MYNVFMLKVIFCEFSVGIKSNFVTAFPLSDLA